jgi:hypothetical protein
LGTISRVGICGTVGVLAIRIASPAAIGVRGYGVQVRNAVVWVAVGVGLASAIHACIGIGLGVLFWAGIGPDNIGQRISVWWGSGIGLADGGITAGPIQRRH